MARKNKRKSCLYRVNGKCTHPNASFDEACDYDDLFEKCEGHKVQVIEHGF